MADIAVSETVKDETKCNAYFQGYIKRQLSATTTKKIANLAAVDTGSFMDGYYFEGISTKKSAIDISQYCQSNAHEIQKKSENAYSS